MNMPATLMWARGLDARPVRVTFAPPAGSNWKPATQLFPTDDPVDVHRAEPAVPDGQPDRAQRPVAPLVHRPQSRRQGVHDPHGASTTTRPRPTSTSTPPAPRRSCASRARCSASSRSSTPAPTRSSATTCRGAAATAWSIATARSSPTAASITGQRARRARHRLARVLPRLERRAHPAEVARAVQLRGSEHVRRAVAGRRLHAVLRQPDHGARRPVGRGADAARRWRTRRSASPSSPAHAVPIGGGDEPDGAVHRRRPGRSIRRTSTTASSTTTRTARRSRWRSIWRCASDRTAR